MTKWSVVLALTLTLLMPACSQPQGVIAEPPRPLVAAAMGASAGRGDAVVCQPSKEQQQWLTQINDIRSVARRCGAQRMAAAPSLQWECRLGSAAQQHALNMVEADFFDHTGTDGLQVDGRVNAQGYAFRFVAENIASGQNTAAAAVQDWLESAGHCENLMAARYTESGLGSATDASSGVRYWVQVLARPR